MSHPRPQEELVGLREEREAREELEVLAALGAEEWGGEALEQSEE